MIPRFLAGYRSERHRVSGNHHLPHVAESTVADTGTLLRDANGSGEYLRGQRRRESPEALRWKQYRKREAPWLMSGDEAPSRPQNHLNGRGHSVVVLARGNVLVMEHGRAVYKGEGPELGGALKAA
jgi:hypothetical protein